VTHTHEGWPGAQKVQADVDVTTFNERSALPPLREEDVPGYVAASPLDRPMPARPHTPTPHVWGSPPQVPPLAGQRPRTCITSFAWIAGPWRWCFAHNNLRALFQTL
jgi:hypothetical protein